jgi:hypothetical protein
MINFKNAIVEEELKHIMFALQNPEMPTTLTSATS